MWSPLTSQFSGKAHYHSDILKLGACIARAEVMKEYGPQLKLKVKKWVLSGDFMTALTLVRRRRERRILREEGKKVGSEV